MMGFLQCITIYSLLAHEKGAKAGGKSVKAGEKVQIYVGEKGVKAGEMGAKAGERGVKAGEKVKRVRRVQRLVRRKMYAKILYFNLWVWVWLGVQTGTVVCYFWPHHAVTVCGLHFKRI